MEKRLPGWLSVAFTGVVLLATGSWAQAQGISGGSASGGRSSGTGGLSSGGSSTGSSFSGGSATSSSFGGGGSTSSRGGSGSANAAYGTATFLGPNYNNPLSFGLSGNTAAGSTGIAGSSSSSFGSTGSGGNGSASGNSSSKIGAASNTGANSTNKAATSTVKFGQPLYNVNPVSTFGSSTSGSATIRSQSTNLNSALSQSQVRPVYSVQVGFRPDQVPLGLVASDFERALQESPELSKPTNRVQAVLDGDVMVLRGVVEDERQKFLAETLARLSPGVRGVRNELALRTSSPDNLESR